MKIKLKVGDVLVAFDKEEYEITEVRKTPSGYTVYSKTGTFTHLWGEDGMWEMSGNWKLKDPNACTHDCCVAK
jgi:hypothetical protein